MEPTSSPVKQKVIVLIEDEEVLANLLTSKLMRGGYEVKSASDGIAGLDLIHNTKPDLVLLDMMLPRLNGFGVLEKMIEDNLLPALPVIMISNSGQSVEVDRALKMGVRDYLIKVNFDPNELLLKVSRLFEEVQKNQAAPATSPIGESALAVEPHILIIEDDIFLVELLERKFVQEKFRTSRAMDVEQARMILTSDKVDVILLDVILPGMDGFVFLHELKSLPQLKEIPVIIISNLGQREEMQRGLEAGAVDYIIKAHATPGEIVEKVRNLLKK